MESEQLSADGVDLEQVSYEKRRKRKRRRRRTKKQSASSSSENSDGDDISSCMASREGIYGDGEASSDAGGEASSVSTEIAPEFGSPDYWDYKRAQLKLMVADRDRNRKKSMGSNVQRSQSDSGTHSSATYITKEELPSLFLNREVFVAVGGTQRAYLVTNVPPRADVNLQISCPDLNIIPSIIHLSKGDERTRPFLFRASKSSSPGQKTLSVAVSGINVESALFTVYGISVVEAVSSVALVDPPCIVVDNAKREGVMLRLNNRVQNAPLKASFDSKSLSVSPEHFIIPPGHSKLGPFALQAKQGSKPGDTKLTVVLSGLSEDAQVNIPNNPHRLDIPGVKISRPITSVKFEPPLDRFLPGTMSKVKLVVDSAPVRNTKVHISPPSGVTVSAPHLLLRSGDDRTEAIFFQASNDIKPGLYTVPIDLISFSNSVEQRLCFEVSIQIASSRNRSLTGLSRASDDQDSSDAETLSVMSYGSRVSNRSSHSSPRKEKAKKDDVSLEQLKHLLSDLQDQRSKLKGPNHLRKRNRVKRRIKAIQERVLEMEREQERQDESESEVAESTKRDPLHRKPPFVRQSKAEKRDPARGISFGPDQPTGTIFARRRMSLPVNNVSDSEQSEDYCKSEIIFPRRPPRGVEKSSDSFELSPQVFTEMMDLQTVSWNTQHVCCWLHSLGMAYRKYVRLFQEFRVVGKELLEFRDEQLRNMGVTSDSHRKRILDELKQTGSKNVNKSEPKELTIKKNVTNKPERDAPVKASPSTSSAATKEMNPLFIINPNLTSIEINNQIKQLQEYQKKLKGSNRKRNKRKRCLETIQKLELLLFDVVDAEKKVTTTSKSASPSPLSSIIPPSSLAAASAHKETASVRNDSREVFKPQSTRITSTKETSNSVEEHAFKTPKKSTETFRFQDSLFKDSDENAFTTLKKEYQHSNIQTKSNHDKSNSEQALVNDAEHKQPVLHLDHASSLDMRDDVSVSSMTLSELDDSEEFNAKLFTGLREDQSELTSDDEGVHSEPAHGGSRRHLSDYHTDEEDSSETEFSEISYGTPGYWAFKRRQLQDMASKRKRRLQAQARNRETSAEGLDTLLEQLQTRLRYLTMQKKQLGGSSHHKRFRIKITKQMQTIQKRISQLHQAKRMRMTRLLDAQRKRKFEETNKEPVRAQKPAPAQISEQKSERTDNPERVEEVRSSDSTRREKRKRLVEVKPKESPAEKTEPSPQKTRAEAFSSVSSLPPPETPPRPVPSETRKPSPLKLNTTPEKKVPKLKIDGRKSVSSLPPEDAKERKPANLELLLSPSSGKTMTRTFQTRVRAQSSNAPSTPSNPSAYASASYWNDRYTKRKQPEEWYEGYQQIKDVLERYIQKNHLIMDLGCGDSSVQDQMREEGYEILACDISTVVLERLAKKDREMITVDAYNLPFTNSSFDVIFDKGTLDALSCDKSRDLKHLFEEIYRVLRPNGKYIVITPWNAPKRLPQLSSVSWRISHEVIPMSLQTLATQRFNQLTDHPKFGRDKDTLMAMSYRQAAEQLEKLNIEEEKQKPPGQSCVMHCYVCAKVSRGISSV